MDTEHKQSYQQVKTRIFSHDNKNKCQIKRNQWRTQVPLAATAILFQNLCRLFKISSGRDGDGRDSKSGRCPLERMLIALPILAAQPLA